MDSAAHAARGAIVAGGGLTLVQSLVARKPQRPSGFALAVGGFVGTFRFIESLGKRRRGHEKSAAPRQHVPSVAAAAAAVVAMYFLEAKKKGLLLSYAALEAALLLAKEHTTLADVKHIEMPMAVLACHRVIYIWIYQAYLYSKSQLTALDGLSHVPREYLARARMELVANPAISRCDVFHPGKSCAQFHSAFLKTHFTAAMKLYIPIYFFSAVLTKYDKWIWGPRPSVRNLLLQYLRTCACLSMSFVIPFGVSCLSPIQHHRTTVTLAGMLTALAMWIEHEKRRVTVIKSIAVYPIAATGAQLALALNLSRRSVSLWQYFIFSASMAVLFQRPERQNAKVMRLLFGHRVPSSASHNAKKPGGAPPATKKP